MKHHESISADISRTIGQIWTALWLMKDQKKSMSILNKVNVQKLFGQDVQWLMN
jgi:hypothetical protein